MHKEVSSKVHESAFDPHILEILTNPVSGKALPHPAQVKRHALHGQIDGRLLLIEDDHAIIQEREHRLDLLFGGHSRILSSHSP